MTRKKVDALGSSGPLAWTSGELVPEAPLLADALAGCDRDLDCAAFAEWLRLPLARYRAHAKAMDSKAQLSVVLRWFEAAAADPAAAVADGRLRAVPTHFAEPAIAHAAMRSGLSWASLLRSGDAAGIGQVLAMAAASLKRQPVRRGRPRARERDRLLRLVVNRLVVLGVERGHAEVAADAVLVACRVPSPEASIARAARRGAISV